MPGLLGRRDEGLPHGVGVVVGLAAGAVVEVVELADDGVARRDHLGEHPSREGEVGVRGRAGRSRHTSARATSRSCRRRRGCVPRSIRWKAWLCALAKPGQDDAAQPDVAVARLGVRGDLGDPPVGHGDPHAAVDLVGQLRVLAPVGRHGGAPPRGRRGPWRGRRPRRGSPRDVANSSGECEMPGGVADEEHRGGDAGVGEDPGVVARSGPDDGYAAQPGREPSHQGGVEGGRTRSRSPRRRGRRSRRRPR